MTSKDTQSHEYVIQSILYTYDMWKHENEIANQKISIYFGVQAILIVALVSAPTPAFVAGLVVSIVWFFSIGRTVGYRNHWRYKNKQLINKLPQVVQSDYYLYPTHHDEKPMPWYAKIPSNWILLSTPVLGILFWIYIVFLFGQ